MSPSRIVLLATAAITVCLPATAEAQLFGRRANAVTVEVINEIPRCTQNLGTVTIAETQNTMFRQMELGHSTEMLRYLIRESGCFQLIERGAGMSLVERERGLGATGRIRTADFVLVAELANHVEADSTDSGSSLLGTLTSVGARAAAAAASAGGGEHAALISRGAGLLSGSGNTKAPESLNQRTLRAITDLEKDIRKGDQDAQMVFSLTSVPLAETVSYNRSQAGRKDVRDLRIRDNKFGGRVGGGFETEESGKIIALAMVRGYADMVTSLGGTGTQTPEVVIANREALEAADADRRAEESRANNAARAEREDRNERIANAERARIAEENRIREQIRQEERERIAAELAVEARTSAPAAASAPVAVAALAAIAPAAPVAIAPTAKPAQITVSRTSVLRDGPSGQPVKALQPGDVLMTTGHQQEQWLEVELTDGTTGWVQADRVNSNS